MCVKGGGGGGGGGWVVGCGSLGFLVVGEGGSVGGRVWVWLGPPQSLLRKAGLISNVKVPLKRGVRRRERPY